MSIDNYLTATAERLPTASELMSVAAEIGVRFELVDGKPQMRTADKNDPVVLGLAKVLRKEPWRSEVVAIIAKSPETIIKPISVEIPCHDCNSIWFVEPTLLEVQTLCPMARCPFLKRARS